MVFELADELFIDGNRPGLMLLLYSALNNQAYLAFNIDTPAIENWIKENCYQDWKLVNDNYISDVASFRMVNRARVLNSLSQSDWGKDIPEITLKDAKNLIPMPCDIWVENGINDGNFIELTLSNACSSLLKTYIENSRVNFKTLGGIGEIKKNVTKFATSMGYRHKRFVFCDSDAPKKGELQPDAEAILKICTDNKTHHHCLKRRSIENYFPIDYLIDNIHPNVRPKSTDYIKYSAFKKLTEEQQHHYHMKVGIMNNPLFDSGLYDDVMETTLLEGDLWAGFTNKYADKFLNKKCDRDKIRSMMLADDKINELSNLESKLIEFIRLPV